MTIRFHLPVSSFDIHYRFTLQISAPTFSVSLAIPSPPTLNIIVSSLNHSSFTTLKNKYIPISVSSSSTTPSQTNKYILLLSPSPYPYYQTKINYPSLCLFLPYFPKNIPSSVSSFHITTQKYVTLHTYLNRFPDHKCSPPPSPCVFSSHTPTSPSHATPSLALLPHRISYSLSPSYYLLHHI